MTPHKRERERSTSSFRYGEFVTMNGEIVIDSLTSPGSGWMVPDSEKESAYIPSAVLIPSLDAKRALLTFGGHNG
jgi:hypothetical protein